MSPASDPFAASNVKASGSTREQLRQAVKAIASNPNVVLVTGAVQFPLLCPNCGAPAQRTLEVKRAVQTFLYNEDSPNETLYEIQSFAVPFCEKCIQQHFAAARPADASLVLKRLFLGSGAGEALGAAIVAIIALFFVKEGLIRLSIFPLIMAFLPGSVAFYLLRKNWTANEYMSAPVSSDVTSAVEFTPDMALAYEPMWRAFRFRDAGYAAQFRAINTPQIWDPQGEAAKQARTKRRTSTAKTNKVVVIVIVIVLLWGLWGEYGYSILDLLDRLR